jgi:hypothetical protein
MRPIRYDPLQPRAHRAFADRSAAVRAIAHPSVVIKEYLQQYQRHPDSRIATCDAD